MGYNNQKELSELKKILESFDCDEEFLEEIAAKIQKHHSIQFLRILLTRLKTLKEYRLNAINCDPEHFESLKHTNGLFSMHVDTREINYRVLYTFKADGTILLHGFEEKKGKKVSGYSKAISVAKGRLKKWGKQT